MLPLDQQEHAAFPTMVSTISQVAFNGVFGGAGGLTRGQSHGCFIPLTPIQKSSSLYQYLEDHRRTSKWLIPMVTIKISLRIGLYGLNGL